MHPILTEQQVDQLDDIFDDDKASALKRMLKSGWLHKASLSVDAVDKKGKGLLSIAAFHNAVKCMKVLLDAGADANQRDENGATPLHWAAGMFNTKAVRVLLEAGANPTIPDNKGSFPLHYVRLKEEQTCRSLLKDAMRAQGMEVPDGPVMTPEELRQRWSRKAVILRSRKETQEPGGLQSFLGRVTRQLPGEERPLDTEGNPLNPLATIFLRDLPNIPPPLEGLALITIFAPQDAWAMDPDEEPTLGCVIRSYANVEGLEPCDYISEELEPCLLTPEPVSNDMPMWPDCGGSDELWNEVCEFEIHRKLDYRSDICEADYETHKLGGYPTYAQGEPDIPDDYAYVMQICSDDNAGLEIADCGRYYFYYNPSTHDWRVYSDCD